MIYIEVAPHVNKLNLRVILAIPIRLNISKPKTNKLHPLLLTALLLIVKTSHAGFELNFQPHSNPTAAGTMIETMQWTGPVGTISSSPFLTFKLDSFVEIPEVVYIDGDFDGTAEPYYHIIVGSLADGFIQESYIQAGYSMRVDGVFINRGEPPGTGLLDGGFGSASAGNYIVTTPSNVVTHAGNASDPLGDASSSGNGTANPRRVVMHQMNTDGEMTSYFRKDTLTNKPYMYQSIDVFGSMNSTFEIDMSNSTYDDDTTAAVIKQNTLQLFGDNLPAAVTGIPDAANWDMSADSQNSSITGGMFTFTDGSDVVDSPGGSEGTYNYAHGVFDVTAVEWAGYFDPYDPTGNPWAVESSKPP